MLSELYKIYRDSNILLARSIVLKSESSIEAEKEYFEMIGYPTINDKRTWKYYMNLAGEYHPTDELMFVLSSDTQQRIPFTKEELVDHPLTRTEYSRGGKHRDVILSEYPTAENLIDRIIKPIDIELAIESEDLTILDYDKKLVASNEVNLIPELQKWIYKFGLRWNVSSMAVTDKLYPSVFIGNIYLAMVNEISNIRISNMRTPMASSWHIWTYLSGHLGLDDYKEFLTTDQALWLYRNIEYIRRNAGKEYIMEDLIKHLLSNRGLTVTKFDMVKSEDILKDFKEINIRVNKSDIVDKNPIIDAGSLLSPEDMFSLTKIRANNNSEYLTLDAGTFEEGVRGTPSNTRKLNVLEISQKLNVLSRFSNNAQLRSDYWIYLSTIGLYRGSLSIPIPGKTALNLSPLEALILMVYASNKAFGTTMEKIPNIMVRGVIPSVYPSSNNTRRFLPDEYVKVDEVVDVLHKDLVQLRVLDGLNALNIFVENITDQDFRHFFARDLSKKEAGKSMIAGAALSLLRNHECILSPEGLTFSVWLDQLEIDLDNLTAEDYLEVAVNCLGVSAGIDENTSGLPSGQRALVELFDMLTSYGLMTLEGRSFNANSTINWFTTGYDDTDSHAEYTVPLSLGGARLGDEENHHFELKYSDVIQKTDIHFKDKGLKTLYGDVVTGLNPVLELSLDSSSFVPHGAPTINSLKITHITD